MKGGVAESAKIKKAAHAAGHTERSVRTARTRLKVEISKHGYQGWSATPIRTRRAYCHATRRSVRLTTFSRRGPPLADRRPPSAKQPDPKD
jgi:hypothetical protein